MREKVLLVVFVGVMALFVMNFIRARMRGESFMGHPPVHRALFAMGKLSLFITWGAIVAASLGWRLFPMQVPQAIRWAGFSTFLAGSAFIVASLVQLGSSTRMGLSDSAGLKTERIYRLSRNPMYVGFLLTSISPTLYLLDPVLFILFCIVAYSHHQIVLAEESFMSERFGDRWKQYLVAVRRYL